MSRTAALSDINVLDSAVLPAPEWICREWPAPESTIQLVSQSRETIRAILSREDPRLLVVVGPCSIHDTAAGLEYARKLKALADSVADRMVVVMRVYFEKPRTTVGWKGLIMDPDLDGTCNLPKGLQLARRFLLDTLKIGLPTATELLDPITPQYISDLIVWSAIGARTTESQTHRQMASGLSMPLGFKNATSGDVAVALNAIEAASKPQTFLGISHQGLASAITTRGNPNCHLILRGGRNGPNFDAASVSAAHDALSQRNLPARIMVDCSHGNSGKDPQKQPEVLEKVVSDCARPDHPVFAVMLESNLVGGSQMTGKAEGKLAYGQSITDGCIGWETTEDCLRKSYSLLAPRF